MQQEETQNNSRPGGNNEETPADRFLDEDGALVSRVRRLVTPVCESEGLELVYIEFQREKSGRVLRFYLDREGGVSIEDCARVSRQASDLLDVYLEDGEAYTLEVSSAGIDRPLGKPQDFERFAGRTVVIKTNRPVDGRKRFKGVLLGMADNYVGITVDNHKFNVPCQAIKKAQLVNDDGVDQW
ncbi:MAG: ribosome maturation factor RimP [Desulfosudaceae bacterium]